MAKAWKEVAQSEQFIALSPEQKQQAQEQYFNQVVAPQVGDNVDAARKQFFSAYDYSQPSQQQPEQPTQQAQQVQQEVEPQQDQSWWSKAKNLVTGDDRMTPEMENLDEIGNAPELNSMSWSAFKTSLGLNTTSDEDKLKAVITQNIPGASFTTDSKGNTIVNLESGQYALNKPGLSGQDVIRGAMDLAAFTPAGRASSIGGAIGANALTEAAMQGAASSVGGGDIDLGDVALSGALGGASKAAENVIGAAYRAARGRPTGQAADATEFARSTGAPLMTSDVNPPSTFVGKAAQSAAEKVPFAGTGIPRAQQQEARKQIISDYAAKFGEYNPDDVYTSLQRQTNRVKQAAGASRQNIINQVSDSSLASNKAIDAIDAEIERLSRSPSGKELATADTATIQKLQDYKADIEADPTFANLERLRTQFRTDVKGERTVMPSRSESAINKIYSAMSDDMSETVKGTLGDKAAATWKKANSIYANEANKIKNTRLKNVLQRGELTPEVVNNMIYSNKPSEFKTLYGSLDVKGKRAARSALIGKAIEKAGDSPERFVNELNKMSGHLGVAFKGNDKKYLNGMQAYLNATRQASKAETMTPTGQQLFQIAIPASIATDAATTGGAGTAGAVAYGVLARAYESAPIRNALTRLNSIPKGSSRFEQQINSISRLLNLSSQTLRRGQETEQ